jgi:ABC-2 type transport system permease protein
MARLMMASETRTQLAAIARLRTQLFVHSLRTTRGTAELVSRIFIGILIAFAGIGGAIGFGAGAWSFVSNASPEWIAIFLWAIFLFWQFFPVMATAFAQSTDSSVFLRFPLSYRSYFLVVVAYGAFDIATALGAMWLTGIWIGIIVGDPALGIWSAIVLLVFAIVNILLARTIFAWIERWLAQRRTREIMGILFFLFVISFQFIGPLMGRYAGKEAPQVGTLSHELTPAQRVLPPGLAAVAIAQFHSRFGRGAGFLALLGVYGVVLLGLLHLRLNAQYRGENLSEELSPATFSREKQSIRPGWRVPGLSGPITAIFEKESHYLLRSGPMLFTLIMPIVMLTVFRVGSERGGGLLARAPEFALPTGAAYALLMLTNLVYNNFGADAGGIQYFFALPVRFRQVVLAKNLVHTIILVIELMLVGLVVLLLYGPPRLDIVAFTIAGLLFALPANLAAGNLLSLYSPKKVEYAVFGRQRAAQTTVLISFAVQFCVFGLAALLFLFTPTQAGHWFAAILVLTLAAGTVALYFTVLNRVDRIALDRRETLIAELCRA